MKEILKKLQTLKLKSKYEIYIEVIGEHIALFVNEKYNIYDDGVIYSLDGKDIPKYIFKLRDKFVAIVGNN